MTTAEKEMNDRLSALEKRLLAQDQQPDKWAAVNTRMNSAAGLLLIVFLLIAIAFRLS